MLDGEKSANIPFSVEIAHGRQLARQGKSNNVLSTEEIERLSEPDAVGRQFLHQAKQKLNWSTRAYHRELKVARSVADLERQTMIQRTHIAFQIDLATQTCICYAVPWSEPFI